MSIKLLLEQEQQVSIETEGTQIEFAVPVITTAQQARLLDLAQGAGASIEGMYRYMAEVLRIGVRDLRIGGQEVDAKELADRADLSHRQTLVIVQAIVREAEQHLFAGEEHAKK